MEKSTQPRTKMTSKKRKDQERCEYCSQKLEESEIKLYPGHPKNALEEYITLTNPGLCLFTGNESDVIESDQWPQQKITHFSVYDEKGHLCPFDTGLIEKNVKLFFSGYVKAIYEENSSPEGGFPTKDMGPINEWWVSGFDGGETALIGFNTAFAEYILMEPSEAYIAFMEPVKEKIYTSKAVIEYLLEEIDPSFEELLNKFDSELLIKHSQFICEQVFSFDTYASIDDTFLITKSCMRSLINLSGVDLENADSHVRRNDPESDKIIRNQIQKRKNQRVKKPGCTKATTTPLVRDTFESFFKDQFRNQERQDPKRVCPNLAVKEADESDLENEDEFEILVDHKNEEEFSEEHFKYFEREAEWIGDPIDEDSGRIFYKGAILDKEEIGIGDCVLIEVNSSTQVAKVFYMFEDRDGNKLIHANWYWKSCDTILGETADTFELFYSDRCDNIAFNTISSKVKVEESQIENKKRFFSTKCYSQSTARFEDPRPRKINLGQRFCPACFEFTEKRHFNIPKVFEKVEEKSRNMIVYGLVKFRGEEFRVGSAVYLKPGSLKFETRVSNPKNSNLKDVNEDIYPEYYRKSRLSEFTDIPDPFNIGYIVCIFSTTSDKLVSPSNIWIKVNKIYRPENTNLDPKSTQKSDLNLIFWSDEVTQVRFSQVVGKCYIAYVGNLNQSVEEWTCGGPDRFYFSEAYFSSEKKFHKPSELAKQIGQSTIEQGVDYPEVKKKLTTLDVFAGCGGLSEGLHQSGIAEVRWAIENDESAASAYRLNSPKVQVFSEDCNFLLSQIMEGLFWNDDGIRFPIRGEVDLLCGGPPCQGFSGMNRFNSRQYSFFKNSLVATYLSYCDYYRPKYFIMENVRSFVSFKKNMVLKLTLRCLTRMGYQCTFGILQAGNYGVPQTRRRMIILAAAPGEILPNFPEPSHVFSKRACQLSSLIASKKYFTNCEWTESAPYRMISVRDAMSDVPVIKNGSSLEEMDYDGEPVSHFQKKIRGNQRVLKDHICKMMAPLVEARMELVPTESGSDWRDLPNIVVRLSDGTYCKKLEYPYNDKKTGKSSTGALRGVCSCCVGKKCDPADKQYNTLIPWCLPHTGNRHNHWAGLYGRLDWNGFFFTTVTNPEPIGKQGRVLHPEQNRVVSVRECARSQGFPDSYCFYGNILEKYRQVGNAVPPPMSAAIGLEIRKCVSLKNNSVN
ncbi:DNA (cytosine-5)-methyltransferase PliMCI-like [Belonocnema kinseyi]|uniref:DNA (cytosine-5)-methyltransferase PliMCI-like n=1 Tax=Belonocnema kinseyi TaxID=2817044 RepID=UPI00143E037F|nr:DNA (cytosine-5)-methyltransferase PliMCI-like [Belonocnema kinseyi]